MAMATMATAAFLLLLLSMSCSRRLVVAVAAVSTEGCTDELILFSACLSYISDPPNNLTESVSDKCCQAFSSAMESGSALCLCYFVRYPNILGFPLNTTRLLSLSSICTPPPPPPPPSPSPSPYAAAAAATPPPPSLNFLCSASPTLPPLNSAATLGITKPAPVSVSDPDSRGGSDGGGRGEGGFPGRMTPKFDENPPRSIRGSSGMTINFPVANGPGAPSTHFCHRNIFLPTWILVILVRLALLNTL